MKNAILGMICGFVIILSTLICLSLYGTQTRKNEMEKNLSQVVESVLKENYISEQFRSETDAYPSSAEVEREIREELAFRLDREDGLTVTVKACDFEKGILSVTVEESYVSAAGNEKVLRFERTAIVE